MTAHDAFTAASHQYIRARSLGNRDRRIPLAQTPSGIGGFVRTLAGFAVWFFFLGLIGRILWQVL
jgi:hypothetical protein